MLNQETKKRIFDARDILVGKIPDPKAQVEQITTALIYKFMDDMDKESVEMGGEPQFFTGKYTKYAWSNLVDIRLGGEERLNLYTEALDEIQQNPNIPQLFRSIFKNAFLPYRDPETLRLFLKKINEFTYDHSEDLGDAFEYLLSVMASQGDAGQFRTPRHIIDFIVKVLNPKKHETVLDHACGTAGFLISSYKHILRENGIKVPGDQLTPDERTRLMSNFVGYDISPDMVRLALVNLYLHDFPDPTIYEYDTLTSEERWNDTFDIIMANPPFMSPTGGIRPHKRFSIQAKRSEILFVDYILEHLNKDGRAGVIVPEGIIFQSGTAYKALRKTLVEKYLYAVVSLPAGIFNPYSGVKTSILLLDRNLTKKTKNILFVKVENDGFDLGAQRKAIAKNDLPHALNILQKYTQAVQEDEDPESLLKSSAPSKMYTLAARSKIAKAGDYNLSGERYKISTVLTNQKWPLTKVSEIAEKITKGTTPTTVGFKFEEEGINFIKIESISEDGAILLNKIARISEACHESLKRSQLKRNDILFSIAGAFGRVGVVEDYLLPANTNQALAIISPKVEAVSPRYLFYILKSEDILREVKNQIVGVAQYNLSLTQVGNLSIPLPPLNIQNEIIAELDSYQKIIDGANQIITNYKPIINNDPSWSEVELGEVAEILTGTTPSTNRADYYAGSYSFIKTAEINNCVIREASTYISEGAIKDYNLKILPPGTVLMAMYGQGKTRGQVALLEIPASITQNAAAIQPNEKVEAKYLYYYLLGQYEYLRRSGIEGHISHLNLGYVKKLKITLPSLEVQRQIVIQIEEEQKLVDANKRLIEIFEQKIKAKIAKVWGYGEATIANELEVEEYETEEPEEIAIEEPEIKQAALFSSF